MGKIPPALEFPVFEQTIEEMWINQFLQPTAKEDQEIQGHQV
jgi:hypothetical protein